MSTPSSLAVYADRRIASVAVMGFASGLPLFLTGSTLAARLTESDVDITSIGLFALASTPYSLKFLWAPVVDRLTWGRRAAGLGRRLAWIVAAQLALAATLLVLAAARPTDAILLTAAAALAVAFFSATQDIAIDAYRVELLSPEQQAAGAAASVFGYRIAMLASGAGALALAAHWQEGAASSEGLMSPWGLTYAAMAGILLFAAAFSAFAAPRPPETPPRAAETFKDVVLTAVVAPLRAFARRAGWPWILTFVVLFKLADALASSLQMPFLLELGFEKPEIAAIAKTFGLVATLGGAFLGGFYVRAHGTMRALLVASVLMLLSNLAFVWLAHTGPVTRALMIVTTIENVTGGFGTAAFVAYLGLLCDREFTATQYALLTSLSSLARTVLSAGAGAAAATLGWTGFFAATAVCGIPALALFGLMRAKGWTGLESHADAA
ncbi:MAG: MFS transporter [Myxococcales bacterium]|nr:MFS transporter [Myxococcales bacterium]